MESQLSKFLTSRLADLLADKNSSDAYIQGQIDLIRELLQLMFPNAYE